MSRVAEHYKDHLAPVYLWMAGGFDAAVARGDAEIEALFPELPSGSSAVDLGAGFGMHAIALARRGCTVLAVDTSALLLGELQQRAGSLPIRTAECDLLLFDRHLKHKTHFIFCMGDTLTHLADKSSVEHLFALAAKSLHAGGKLVLTFRDYTPALVGAARIIAVRSDAERILTCILDYSPEYVTVYDLIHERTGKTWEQRVSSYEKLRLSPTWVCAALQSRGFSVQQNPGPAGMVRIVATLAK